MEEMVVEREKLQQLVAERQEAEVRRGHVGREGGIFCCA